MGAMRNFRFTENRSSSRLRWERGMIHQRFSIEPDQVVQPKQCVHVLAEKKVLRGAGQACVEFAKRERRLFPLGDERAVGDI